MKAPWWEAYKAKEARQLKASIAKLDSKIEYLETQLRTEYQYMLSCDVEDLRSDLRNLRSERRMDETLLADMTR